MNTYTVLSSFTRPSENSSGCIELSLLFLKLLGKQARIQVTQVFVLTIVRPLTYHAAG